MSTFLQNYPKKILTLFSHLFSLFFAGRSIVSDFNNGTGGRRFQSKMQEDKSRYPQLRSKSYLDGPVTKDKSQGNNPNTDPKPDKPNPLRKPHH
jgi:hypothetical protein